MTASNALTETEGSLRATAGPAAARTLVAIPVDTDASAVVPRIAAELVAAEASTLAVELPAAHVSAVTSALDVVGGPLVDPSGPSLESLPSLALAAPVAAAAPTLDEVVAAPSEPAASAFDEAAAAPIETAAPALDEVAAAPVETAAPALGEVAAAPAAPALDETVIAPPVEAAVVLGPVAAPTELDAMPATAEQAAGPPIAILRGNARGLELVVRARAGLEAIASAVAARLAEAPAFFRGCDVRVRVEDGPLAPGSLTRLDEIAAAFGLRIIEIAAARPRLVEEAIPRLHLAAGSAPAPAALEPAALEPAAPVAPPRDEPPPQPSVETPPAAAKAAAAAASGADTATGADDGAGEVARGTRVVVGPVRSGVILEQRGHLVVFGDVNPGAEIRAEGNIVVLGRLRGTAHAGIGRDAGFILALRLEPQQLRICRQVARAGDADAPGTAPEIAYAAGTAIVVERYQGRLPRSLADSIESI